MGRGALRAAPLDAATELAGCAVFGLPFVTAGPDPEVLGEVGEVIGQVGDGLRLRFTPEQASRMAERLEEAERAEA